MTPKSGLRFIKIYLDYTGFPGLLEFKEHLLLTLEKISHISQKNNTTPFDVKMMKNEMFWGALDEWSSEWLFNSY